MVNFATKRKMYLTTPSEFISVYLDRLSKGLSEAHPEYRLTLKQKLWLGFSSKV